MDDQTVDYTTQLAELDRQAKLAAILRTNAQRSQEGMTPGHMGQVGYIPTSGANMLATLLQGIKANQAESSVTDQQKALNQQMQQHAQEWRSSLPQAIAARAEQAGPPLPGGSPELAAQPAQPVTMEQVLRKTMAASGNPLLKNDAAQYEKLAGATIDREDRQQQARDQGLMPTRQKTQPYAYCVDVLFRQPY